MIFFTLIFSLIPISALIKLRLRHVNVCTNVCVCAFLLCVCVCVCVSETDGVNSKKLHVYAWTCLKMFRNLLSNLGYGLDDRDS